MSIAFIGPSGAGKGTHASKLAAKYGLVHISTGELFRHSVEAETSLGLMAQDYMNKGKLITDEVVDSMIAERLRKTEPNQQFLFDGFPRTLFQAQFLDEVMTEIGQSLEAVIYLHTSDEEILRRLPNREICRVCQTPFNKLFAPFETCPYGKCTGEFLYQREDDSLEVVPTRLHVFHAAVIPLLAYYLNQQKLIIVNSEGAIDEVYTMLVNTMEAVRNKKEPFATLLEVQEIEALRGKPAQRLSPEEALHVSMDLVLLAPPGSGKGTQAEQLKIQLGLKHIATGDIFRGNIKGKTPLGKLAQTYINRGELVPDDVTQQMLRDRLSQPDIKSGFVLDGFPRTLPQAEALTDILVDMNRRIDAVIHIRVSDEEIVSRLSGRLICRDCQTPYHLQAKPPQQANVCDNCGGSLYRREDDNPDTVYARLTTYNKQTAPLIDYYRRAGLLVEIDGEGAVTEVTQRMMTSINYLIKASRVLMS